tara:strand:- start:6330 stop:8087 length:1758 start_codon:yes stop_codon:yes gene_type:complete
MAKVTKENLTRGVKLTTQHVFTPLAAVKSELENVNIESEQIDVEGGSFRLNFNIPCVDSTAFPLAHATDLDNPLRYEYSIPFTLPPLQEFFEQRGSTVVPSVVLEEFNISFDQRSEAATITDYQFLSGGNKGLRDGFLNYQNMEAYDIEVALMEKPVIALNASAGHVPTREVFSLSLRGAALFGGTTYRNNPATLDKINKSIDPFRSYLLMIHAPKLLNGTVKSALPSLQMSLKFRHELVERDKAAAGVQNQPTHNGAQTGPSITIGSPAGTDTITADTADGVQLSIHRLDNVFVDGLSGGYGKDSTPSPTEEIKDDSCYEVIAVPMWSNFTAQRYISSYAEAPGYTIGDASSLPYVGVDEDEPTCDRRIIPIQYPFVVHHVIAAVSYAAPGFTNDAVHPTSHTFISEVGVGIGTGFMGDLFDYQQVAYGKWTPSGGANPKSAITIDQIKSREGGLLSGDSDEPWDYELLSIPLVRDGATDLGSGYFDQGKPFFIGKTTNLFGSTTARTSCGNVSNVSGTPKTEGCEQFIEVRWSFGDASGLLWSGAPAVGGIQSNGEIYVGYNGFWVYIIGKKALAGSSTDVPL